MPDRHANETPADRYRRFKDHRGVLYRAVGGPHDKLFTEAWFGALSEARQVLAVTWARALNALEERDPWAQARDLYRAADRDIPYELAGSDDHYKARHAMLEDVQRVFFFEKFATRYRGDFFARKLEHSHVPQAVRLIGQEWQLLPPIAQVLLVAWSSQASYLHSRLFDYAHGVDCTTLPKVIRPTLAMREGWALQMLHHLPDNVLKAVEAIQAKDVEPDYEHLRMWEEEHTAPSLEMESLGRRAQVHYGMRYARGGARSASRY
ncbi:hypothetical protein Rhopal_003191-T1 [Rhodotorula paludigena]|uniref:Alternative oxidase n=1 Tax=Rhodotorula paludigena TaxID=86838 RepID=A0AAV5GLE7_9BASI|nr:hypothetical protein Rhopal_003191-T1 [Rhodotorula paludigena]